MVLDTWYSNVKRSDDLFNSLTDDQLQIEIAPGKNRVIYVLANLAAVHDKIMPFLELGDQMYPQLYEDFVNKPDKAVAEVPPANELRAYWKNIHTVLAKHFESMQADDWFQKHTSVTIEDFSKEPHRNKLNIIISRTNHLSYHLGQLVIAE